MGGAIRIGTDSDTDWGIPQFTDPSAPEFMSAPVAPAPAVGSLAAVFAALPAVFGASVVPVFVLVAAALAALAATDGSPVLPFTPVSVAIAPAPSGMFAEAVLALTSDGESSPPHATVPVASSGYRQRNVRGRVIMGTSFFAGECAPATLAGVVGL